MKLSILLRRLPEELARLSPAEEAEARSNTCLEPVAVLVDGVRRSRDGSPVRRKTLIVSILGVHQASPHRVWSTLLLHAFTPMVKKLRKELVGGDADTRDEIVLMAFHEAIATVPVNDPLRIFMYVRQEMRRRAFKALQELTAWEEIGFGTEADLEPDPSTIEEPPLIGVWLQGHGTRPEQAELLATLVDHGGLRALARREHPDLTGEEEVRAFRCLQKKRQRLIGALRDQLAAEAPE